MLTLVGFILAGAGFFGSLSTFQSLQAQAFAGGLAAVALAMVNGLASLSGLAGAYIVGVLKDATGSTDRGLLIISVLFLAAAIMIYFTSRWTEKATGGLSTDARVSGTVTAPADD
ncbi:hypothetical protein ACWDO0_02535 [Nocardia rhamnosiphila]